MSKGLEVSENLVDLDHTVVDSLGGSKYLNIQAPIAQDFRPHSPTIKIYALLYAHTLHGGRLEEQCDYLDDADCEIEMWL